eukprot:TRINITY_DN6629_c0_g1_i6.p1 TRINITY_DN6629_c0_g1~~TRINITY_DN6629_c0_g1_i6.p1  ORF type:complete len:235 (+),score=34.07 TRINITY_DN6629_c0_g1_i6:840-1544(+)
MDKVVTSPKLTMAECIFIFNKISASKEFLTLRDFREWVKVYGNGELKPLINLNVKLVPDLANKVSADELSIPLAVKKLIEEMREYGLNHIEDALEQFISETQAQLSENLSPPKISRPLSFTNLQRLFSVLNIPTGIEDAHELKNWLLENELLAEYEETDASGIVVSFVVDAEKMWNCVVGLYEVPSVEVSSELAGSSFKELAESIKYTILQTKLNGTRKVKLCISLDTKFPRKQ